jgi:hypothetical protein
VAAIERMFGLPAVDYTIHPAPERTRAVDFTTARRSGRQHSIPAVPPRLARGVGGDGGPYHAGMADPLAALITAAAALVGAFLGSIGRPIAEDRVAQWREARAEKGDRAARARARIEMVRDLLAEASMGTATQPWYHAQANLTSATAAVNDERLTAAVGRYKSGGGDDELRNAQWRAGELLLEADEAGR